MNLHTLLTLLHSWRIQLTQHTHTHNFHITEMRNCWNVNCTHAFKIHAKLLHIFKCEYAENQSLRYLECPILPRTHFLLNQEAYAEQLTQGVEKGQWFYCPRLAASLRTTYGHIYLCQWGALRNSNTNILHISWKSTVSFINGQQVHKYVFLTSKC